MWLVCDIVCLVAILTERRAIWSLFVVRRINTDSCVSHHRLISNFEQS